MPQSRRDVTTQTGVLTPGRNGGGIGIQKEVIVFFVLPFDYLNLSNIFYRLFIQWIKRTCLRKKPEGQRGDVAADILIAE